MKARRIATACALSLLACLTANAAEPRVGKFVRFDAGEFVIVTSRSSLQARHFMEQLTMFRVALERTLGKRATRKAAPTTILITSNADWSNWLQPRQSVTGFFQRGRFSNYLAMNGDSSPQETLHLVFHEYTHYYLATQFAGEYPPWFNEGLAELMGYARFKEGTAILAIPLEQVSEARDGDWIPFERLIRVKHNDPEYQSHRLGPSFYAQSWLTVHYGLIENRDFGRQILEYLARINTLVPPEEAARQVFGADLSVIDSQLRAYSRSKRMTSGGVSLGELPPVTLAEGVPLGDLDTLEILADVMIETQNPPARIRPLIDSLQRREPDAARPAILAARVALLANDNAAFEAAVAKAETSLAPDDWLQRRKLASVLLNSMDKSDPKDSGNGESADRYTARAMKWFAEALQHNNADVEALWGFGTAATRLDKNLDLAEQALVSAYQRAPSNADIAMSLVHLKAKQQKPEEMIPFLEDVIRLSTNLGMRSWAADTLVETKNYIVERDKVEEENKKKRDQYEKRKRK